MNRGAVGRILFDARPPPRVTTMHRDIVEAHVRALYEAAPLADPSWSPDLRFSDPLVLVEGERAVHAMFERLAGMVPATRVLRCAPLVGPGGDVSRWALEVDWRRSMRGSGLRLQSMLDVRIERGRVVALTEHWRAPLLMHGDPPGPFRSWLRRSFGRWSARPV